MSELTAAGFNHPSREELTAFAQGDLQTGEAALIEQHLKVCDQCRGMLLVGIPQERRAFSYQAPGSAPLPAETPNSLAEGDQAAPPAAPALSFWRKIPWLAVALVLAITAGAILGWMNISQASQLRSLQQMQESFQRIIHNNQASLAVMTQPGLRVTEFSGKQGAGNVVFGQDGKSAAIFLQKIAASDSGHTYQVWLVPASGSPQSTGTFNARPGQPYVSYVINSAQPLSQFTSIQITVEPKGGSPQPTTAPILTAKY